MDNDIRRKLRRYTKKSLKIGSNTILLDSIPKKYREYVLKEREGYKEKIKPFKILKSDKKVYLNKYYPWCYYNYMPRLVLQGWYKLENAKQFYILKYGPDALKHIKFIKGKEALENDFIIGKSLYINGNWILITSKIVFGSINKQSFKKKITEDIYTNDYSKMEDLLMKNLKYYTIPNGGNFSKIKRKKRSKLQKVQETLRKRKESFYEE